LGVRTGLEDREITTFKKEMAEQMILDNVYEYFSFFSISKRNHDVQFENNSFDFCQGMWGREGSKNRGKVVTSFMDGPLNYLKYIFRWSDLRKKSKNESRGYST
jgi:hypothetical protein